MTDTKNKNHHSVLQRIAHRVMIERGLLPDTCCNWTSGSARRTGCDWAPRPDNLGGEGETGRHHR